MTTIQAAICIHAITIALLLGLLVPIVYRQESGR